MLNMRISEPSTNFDQLVDHIAEHGFCVVNDFLPASVISELAQDAHRLKQSADMREAGIGREHSGINKSIRGDSIYWLNAESATAAQRGYFEQMESLRQRLNQHLYLGLFELECHLAVYPQGAFYKKHLDCFASQHPSKPQRRVSCIVYLNQGWKAEDGGELKLYLNERDETNGTEEYESILIAPLAGRAVIFLSDTFYHEVLPTNKERISLTGWFLSRPAS